LTQLPFQVLVTAPHQTAMLSIVADYRNVAWLVRKHAIMILPAVSSLKALRELAKESHASEPYIGFGNPLLDGEPERFKNDGPAAKLAREKRCELTSRKHVASVLSLRGGTGAITRSNGGIADIADLRHWPPNNRDIQIIETYKCTDRPRSRSSTRTPPLIVSWYHREKPTGTPPLCAGRERCSAACRSLRLFAEVRHRCRLDGTNFRSPQP
jgi:hypothetical protein